MDYTDFIILKDYNVQRKKEIPIYERIGNKGIIVNVPDQMIKKSEIISNIRDNNHKHDKRANHNPNATLIGLYGECAFGYHYNLPIDWEIKRNDEYDFAINDNFIDVKTTEDNEYLNIKKRRFKNSNKYIYVYCICKLSSNIVKIVGWKRGSDILNNATENRKYSEPFYQFPHDKLNSMSEFII